MSVREALERALSEVEVKPQDAALVALARDAAATVDSDKRRAVSAGGLLLKALVELRMTPKARTEVTKGRTGEDGAGQRAKLRDELRARRQRRGEHAS